MRRATQNSNQSPKNTSKRTSNLAASAIMLLLFFATIPLHISPSHGGDLRNKEVMIEDKSCIENKIAQCIINTIVVPLGSFSSSGSCPKTMHKIGSLPSKGFGTTLLCKYNDINSMISAMRNEYESNIYKPISSSDKPPRALFLTTLTDCRMMVHNFPNYYQPNTTPQSCLKPLAQERLLNAIGIEIKRLRSSECTDENCSKLDKVPAQ